MISLGGHRVDAGPPNVHLDHPNIWETVRARTLKLKTPLDMVKRSLCVHFFPARGSPGKGPLKITRFGYKMSSEQQK